MIDVVIRTGKSYYLQAFLEECKYFVKEKKMPEVYYWPNKNLFQWFWSEDSDEEIYNEEKPGEENSNKEN